MTFTQRVIGGLAIAIALVIGASGAAVAVAETAWFKDWLRGFIVRESRDYLNGELAINRLSGNLVSGIELQDVSVQLGGRTVVAVQNIRLAYSVVELITRGVSIKTIELSQPTIYLRSEDETWSIARLIKKERAEADRQGPAKPIAISDISVTDATVVMESPVEAPGVVLPRRIQNLTFKGSFRYQPIHYVVDVSHLSFRGAQPDFSVTDLSGRIGVRDDDVYFERVVVRTPETSIRADGTIQHYLTKPHTAVKVAGERVSTSELARVVPALSGIAVTPAFEIAANGPADQLRVSLKAQAMNASISANAVVGLTGDQTTVAGDASVVHLNLAPLTGRSDLSSEIDAKVHVDLRRPASSNPRSLHGTVRLEASRAAVAGYVVEQVVADARLEGSRGSVTSHGRAYGANATASGDVDWSKPELLQYNVSGRLRAVNLAALPRQLSVPRASTDVNTDYRVHTAGGTGLSVEARFLPSTVAGAQIAPGSTASVDLTEAETRYKADLTLSSLNLRRVGREFDLAAIDAERFDSAINGHVAVEGAGRQLKDLQLRASGEVADSTLAGAGIPDLTFSGSLQGDTARVTADGRIRDLDPTALGAPERLKGRISGAFNLDATASSVSLGSSADVVADVKANVDPSTVGPIALDRVSVDGTYRGDVAEIRQFSLEGSDLRADATGTVSLVDEQSSNLTFHAQSTDLKTIGEAFGLPISGIGTVSGKVEGDRRNPQVSGNLTANDFTYDTTQALTVSTDYTVQVPDLRVEDATASTNTAATFVVLGGQTINELAAKVDYANRQLTFDAQAKQPERSLTANGSMRLLPEEQNVKLEHLAVQARGRTWQTAPGSAPEFDYSDGAIAVRHLGLVSGNQQITADGTLGRAGESLNVRFSDVDLTNVDALLLRAPQFSGRLNLSGALTGSREMPRFKGEFRVEQGGFRKFQYQQLTGMVESDPAGIKLDVRLQQNPSAWITAAGYVPLAAFQSSDDDRSAAADHEVAADSSERFDLQIESSSIDLGVIQGLTTTVTEVQGTVQGKVKIGGSAHDPHPDGEITVANGSLKAMPTGVSYTGLNGRFELRPDRLRIDGLRIQDGNRNGMSIAGDLAIHERQLGGVNISVKADDFTVLNNEMGRVHVDGNIRLAGDLIKPRIEGDLGISSGRLELDPLLAALGSSAYALKPTEYGDRAAKGSPTANAPTPDVQPPAGSFFDRLQLDVHFKVPDDLVLRGSDLKAAGAPVGLGAANFTLGGDLRAQKDAGGPFRLTGSVNTVRGTYDFQGRRFEILRNGSIRFAGLDTLDPTLDLRARRIIVGVEARVNIRGTLMNPQLVLSSVPPLEQADILALIVFNQPVNQLGEGQQASLAQRAAALATGAVVGELASSIGKALNLDTFEIQTASDNASAVQVTAGQQIGEHAFVKLEQGVGDQSQTNFVFDYQFRDWLRLQSNILLGAGIQQSLFNRVQGSGFDILVTLPNVK